jgi:hypothetical protein
VVALAVVHVRPAYAPDSENYRLRERIAALRKPWQFVALFIATIGGIYAGIFSPTEAASIGAFGAILLGVLGRRMEARDLLRAIESPVVLSCLLLVIVRANLFSSFVVQTRFAGAPPRRCARARPLCALRLIGPRRGATRLPLPCHVPRQPPPDAASRLARGESTRGVIVQRAPAPPGACEKSPVEGEESGKFFV